MLCVVWSIGVSQDLSLMWHDLQEAMVDDVNNGVARPAAAAAAAGPGILSLSWTFIVSFFSSLAPQQPPPVNAN